MSENKNENNGQQFQNPYQAQAYPYYYYPQASQAYYPYDYRQFQFQPQQPPVANIAEVPGVAGMLPEEESYIENILRLNKGKVATVYMSFENDSQWSSKVFKGVVEAAGRDHIILSDPQTDRRYLLLMIYLDYVTFEGEINYNYPYSGAGQTVNYPPR